MKRLFFLLLIPFYANAQIITEFGGGGAVIGDGGPATNAQISDPGQMIFDKTGNLYIASGTGNRIRKIDTTGIITTIAGTGFTGYSGDSGLATAAKFNFPSGIALDTTGNIFIADAGNNAIRKINIVTGIISTICGNGSVGYSGDGGPATAAQLYGPNCIGFDRFNNLFIADCNNNVVRKINPAGIITTVAGIAGTYGYNGDGIPATDAKLYLPTDVQEDDSGNIYIADGGNARIRKVNLGGIISTFAGNGVGTFIGDGMPATAEQLGPELIRFDAAQNLYVSDENNTNLRVYVIDHTTGLLRVVAGNGNSINYGDGGPATAASFAGFPSGLAVDKCGNLFIGNISSTPDSDEIRKVTFNIPDTAIISLGGVSSAPLGSTVTITATVTCLVSGYTIIWYDNGIPFDTTTALSTSYIKTAGTDTITARVVPSGTCNVGATSIAHLVNDSSTGIDDISMHERVDIYPNPATGKVNLSFASAINSIVITNPAGRVVLSQTCNTERAQIDIVCLPTGMYFLKVNDMYMQKLIKE